MEDLDEGGERDLVTSERKGAHLFGNLKIDREPKATREEDFLLDKQRLFKGQGVMVKQVDGLAPRKSFYRIHGRADRYDEELRVDRPLVPNDGKRR